MPTTEDKEILFGGTFQSTIPKTPEFRKPEGRPTWVVALEEAFVKLTSTEEGKQLYGDPQKGATLEQAWRTSGILTGKWPVCLLALEKPSVTTDKIDRVIRMNQQQLVNVVADILRLSENAAVQILYYDGSIGHSITLLRYDSNTSRFIYHDPWPGTSLLCKDYNAAGIDAKRTEDNLYWSITATELERVIFASFIWQNFWAEYMHEKYYATYDEFKNSDFWSFFHITEVQTQPQDNKDTLITLRPGGFQSEINLKVTLNQKQQLKKGQLDVKRSWLTGPPYGLNPFGLDIVRSFITTMVSPSDKQNIQGLIEMLHKIQDTSFAERLIAEGPEKSIIHNALFTFLGLAPSFDMPLHFSEIIMANSIPDGTEWLQTTITVDVLN